MTSIPTSRWTRSLAGAALVATLALTACGSSDDASGTDEPDATQPSVPDTGSSEAQSAAVQTSPVEVTGDPLPEFTPEFADPASDPAVGTPSPVLSGVGFDGTPMTVGGPTENPTFVVFLAHWCPACNAEVPELVGLAEEDGFPEGLDVMAVSTAVAEDRDNYPPSEWFDAQGWPFPAMVDSDETTALRAVGADGFPFGVVLDTDGTVLGRSSGQTSADVTVAFLEEALAGSGA